MKPARSAWRTWPLALLIAVLLSACTADCEACQTPNTGALGFRLCLTEAPDSAPAANRCLDVTLAYDVTN
jgi:hypothetical protein